MTNAPSRARRDSWRIATPPAAWTRLRCQRRFTTEEHERLAAGVVPQTMDDKWFIFLEGDVLFFHRSWTGSCIFQVRLASESGTFAVVEALANRDPAQYGARDDEWDVELLDFVIDHVVLGRDVSLRLPPHLRPDATDPT